MEARNANYAAIVRHLQFRKRAWLGLHLADNCDDDRQLRSGHDSDSDTSEEAEGLEDAEQAIGPASCGTVLVALQTEVLGAAGRMCLLTDLPPLHTQAIAPLLQGQGMRDAEMVIWLGDFNYRVELSFEVAKEKARRKLLTDLLAKVRNDHA